MQISDEMLEGAASAMYSHGDKGVWKNLEEHRKLFWRSYALAALEAALSAAEPSVAMKALEWAIDENCTTLQRADFYTIESGYRQGFALHISGKMGIQWFATEHEAKDAAQVDFERRIRSALTAQVQDVAVPEGWQLVPKEPTYKMLLAGSFVDWGKYPDKKEAVRDVWNAMNRNADNSAAPAKQEG